MLIAVYILSFILLFGFATGLLLWMNAAVFFAKKDKYENKDFSPPISVIKPVRGLNEKDEENFRTFFQQKYPNYELIFVIHKDAGEDPAIPIIKRLIEEYPEVDAKLIRSSEKSAVHEKVNNYIYAIGEAAHDIICISDADVYVDKDYLSRDVKPLSDDNVGAVTALQTMTDFASIATAFEGLLQNYDNILFFMMADNFNSVNFVYGHSLFFRKGDFYKLNAKEAVKDHMLDDQAWGEVFVHRAGKRIHMSKHIAHTRYRKTSFAAAVKHIQRWAVFDFRLYPVYALVNVHQNTAFAVALFAITFFIDPALSFPAAPLSLVFGLRIICAAAFSMRFFGMLMSNLIFDYYKKDALYFWLIPFRDIHTVFIVLTSLFISKFEHAGFKYRITKNNKLERIE